MTAPFDTYWQAVRTLDGIGPSYEQAIATSEADRKAAIAAADQAAAQTEAQASALTTAAEAALASGRQQLDQIEQANRLPARVHPSAPDASASEVSALLDRRLDELTAAVNDVVEHRDASRRRRLDEGAARERDVDEERARAEAQARRRASEQAWAAWHQAKRRADLTALSVAGGLALLGIIFAVAGVTALAVLAFVLAIIVSPFVRNRLQPNGTPPPRPSSTPDHSNDQWS